MFLKTDFQESFFGELLEMLLGDLSAYIRVYIHKHLRTRMPYAWHPLGRMCHTCWHQNIYILPCRQISRSPAGHLGRHSCHHMTNPLLGYSRGALETSVCFPCAKGLDRGDRSYLTNRHTCHAMPCPSFNPWTAARLASQLQPGLRTR